MPGADPRWIRPACRSSPALSQSRALFNAPSQPCSFARSSESSSIPQHDHVFAASRSRAAQHSQNGGNGRNTAGEPPTWRRQLTAGACWLAKHRPSTEKARLSMGQRLTPSCTVEMSLTGSRAGCCRSRGSAVLGFPAFSNLAVLGPTSGTRGSFDMPSRRMD